MMADPAQQVVSGVRLDSVFAESGRDNEFQ
jgi:hypothetical protein